MQSGFVAGQLQDSLPGQSNPPHPTLNFDIFHQIMATTTDKSTVLSCMQTCRALHASGVPILLRFPVNIDNYKQLASFCTFMLVKHPPRTQCLRQLQFVFWNLNYGLRVEERDFLFGLFSQVLERAEHLEDLDIRGTEELIKLAPWLSDTLCNLTNLRSLAVSGFGQKCSLILSRMDTPKMRRLRLHLFDRNLSSPLKPPSFQDYLEELQICGPAEYEKFNLTMPRVTKLTLEYINLREFFVSPLLKSFPNLKSFGLITDIRPRLDGDFCQSRHLLNQSQYHDGDWDQLSYVKGTALDLYVLGLKSSVEHLELVRFDKKGLPFLSTLLHDMRPTLLSLGFARTWATYLNALASSDSFTLSTEIHPPHVNLNIRIAKESGGQDKIIDALLTIGAALHADYLTAHVEFCGDRDDSVKSTIWRESKALDLAVTSRKLFQQCTIEFTEEGVPIWGITY